MKKEMIKARCELHNYTDNALFVEWFARRFPNESNEITSYVDEWIGRFQGGHHKLYMDIESRALWNEIEGL